MSAVTFCVASPNYLLLYWIFHWTFCLLIYRSIRLAKDQNETLKTGTICTADNYLVNLFIHSINTNKNLIKHHEQPSTFSLVRTFRKIFMNPKNKLYKRTFIAMISCIEDSACRPRLRCVAIATWAWTSLMGVGDWRRGGAFWRIRTSDTWSEEVMRPTDGEK